MSGWRYEIETTMDSGVRDEPLASYTDLLLKILGKLIIDIFQYGSPTFVIVDLISKTRCISYS
jgi:hypothetical protein